MSATRIGPYRILRPLGEGGMGAVYEAIHESIERRVALKVLHPEHARHPDAVTRFFNEARTVNRIEHPNIVQVSEFGRADDGTTYLVMEFLRGETLSRRLETLSTAGQRVSTIESIQIAVQLADALAAAHDKGIVHRDLKPGNVMLVPDGLAQTGERVKLLDFGIAKLTQGTPPGKATTANALMGTPQYMSPEQCRGAGGVDDRTDVYALGVMLYELAAGRPPFLAEEPIGYLMQHASKPPPALESLAPQAPAELCALVHRLLAKEKSARPAMREVHAELARILSALSGHAPMGRALREPYAASPWAGPPNAVSTLGGSLGQTVRSQPPRRRLLLAAMCASVLLAAGLGARLFRSSGVSSPVPVVQPHPITLPQAVPPAPATPLLANEPPTSAKPQKPAESPPPAESPKPAAAEASPLPQASQKPLHRKVQAVAEESIHRRQPGSSTQLPPSSDSAAPAGKATPSPTPSARLKPRRLLVE